MSERTETPEYVAERVRQAVATDPRTTVQGLVVRATDAELFLAGDVGSEERRRAVAEVASEVAPGLRLHNDVKVVELGGEHTPERIR